jgi:hypothetical protein
LAPRDEVFPGIINAYLSLLEPQAGGEQSEGIIEARAKIHGGRSFKEEDPLCTRREHSGR